VHPQAGTGWIPSNAGDSKDVADLASVGQNHAREGGMASLDSAALVLNATYEPLCVVPSRRAVILLLTAKAVSVAEGDGVVHSVRAAVVVPAVVRLTRFVRVPYRATVPLTRKAVFARDGGRCVYCNAAATSLDHVIPKSRGGAHSWDNVVSACGRCNHVKADRGIAELGWRLHRQPVAPTGAAWRVVGSRRVDPRWRPWLDLPFEESLEEPA
jgi:5-methylcytosine-specific restriction endonuclease McrA